MTIATNVLCGDVGLVIGFIVGFILGWRGGE